MSIFTQTGAIRDTTGMGIQEISLSSSERVPASAILECFREISEENRISYFKLFYESSMNDFFKSFMGVENSTNILSDQLSKELIQLVQNRCLYYYPTVLQKDIILELEVVRAFSDISEVKTIYLERNQSTYLFKVFITSKSYDDSLMDRLLDRELSLLNNFPDLGIAFHYIPYFQELTKKGMISESAKQIYIK